MGSSNGQMAKHCGIESQESDKIQGYWRRMAKAHNRKNLGI